MPTLINSFSLSSTVGIGTNTPNKNLTVIGEVSASRNLYIGGDINVYGTLYTYGSSIQLSSTNLTVGDPLIYFANNNSATNNPYDIGFVGHFNDSTAPVPGIGYQHTGFVRNHNTGTWTLFSGVTTEPADTNTIAWNDPSFKVDTITANLSGGSFNTTNLTATNILSVNNIAGLGGQTVFSDGVNTNGNGSGTATLNYTNGIYGNASKYVLNGGNLTVAGTISGFNFRSTQGIPNNVDASTVGYSFGPDGDTGLFSPIVGGGFANGVVSVYANNTEVMRATSPSNVGTVNIGGNASGGGSLTVAGTISATGNLYSGSPSIQKTSNYILKDSDSGSIIYFNSSSPLSAVLPNPNTVRDGFQVTIIQAGTGQVGVSANGNTLHQAYTLYHTSAQWSAATLAYSSTFNWTLFGDLA